MKKYKGLFGTEELEKEIEKEWKVYDNIVNQEKDRKGLLYDEAIDELEARKDYSYVLTNQTIEMLEKLKLERQRLAQSVKEAIDEIDVELLFTDIKNKEGKRVELSDGLMEIIGIWWDKKSKELKQKLGISEDEKLRKCAKIEW